MQKKIAIAVDGSPNSSDAMRYAAALYSRIPDLYFVLLNIQPTISHYLLEEAEKSGKARRTVDEIAQSNRAAALQILVANLPCQ